MCVDFSREPNQRTCCTLPVLVNNGSRQVTTATACYGLGAGTRDLSPTGLPTASVLKKCTTHKLKKSALHTKRGQLRASLGARCTPLLFTWRVNPCAVRCKTCHSVWCFFLPISVRWTSWCGAFLSPGVQRRALPVDSFHVSSQFYQKSELQSLRRKPALRKGS